MSDAFLDKAPGEMDYAYWNGGKRRARRQANAAEIYSAYLEGMTVEEIAESAYVTEKAVTNILQLHFGVTGLETSEDKFRKGLFGPIFQATVSEAAEICGVTPTSMGDWCRKHNIEPLRDGRARNA